MVELSVPEVSFSKLGTMQLDVSILIMVASS